MSGSQPDDGERVIQGSRRPDGTYRKDVRVRAGYVPQDEQPVYVPRGALVCSQKLVLPRSFSASVCPAFESPFLHLAASFDVPHVSLTAAMQVQRSGPKVPGLDDAGMGVGFP